MNAHRTPPRQLWLVPAALALVGLALAPARGAGGTPTYTLSRLNAPASTPVGTLACTERINAQNQVAGFYFLDNQVHAAVWLPDGSGKFGESAPALALPENVLTFGPAGIVTEQGSASHAVAVGDGGMVVGGVTVPDPLSNNQPMEHACVWVRDSSGQYTGYDVQPVLFAGVSGVFSSTITDVRTVNGVPIAIGRSNRLGTDTTYSGWIGAVSINPANPAQSSTTLANLPPVSGQTSNPLRLNASGDVAGESNSYINGVNGSRATEWRVTVTPPSGGQATQIQVAPPIELQGPLSGLGAARGLTNTRAAAGFFEAGDGKHHAFRTQPSSTAINSSPAASGGDDLGLLPLPGGGFSLNSYANDLAKDDVVGGAAVGSSEDGWVSHQGGPLVDLNGAGVVTNPSLYFLGATSVNDSGVIVGCGQDGSNILGYFLTPLAAPAPTLQDLRLRVANQSDFHNVTVAGGASFTLEGVLSASGTQDTTVYVQVFKGTQPVTASTLGLSDITVLSGNGVGHVVGTAPQNTGTTAAVYTIVASLSPFQAGQSLPADAKQVTLTVRPAGPPPTIGQLRISPPKPKSGQPFDVQVFLKSRSVGDTRVNLVTSGLPSDAFGSTSTIVIPNGQSSGTIQGRVSGVFGTLTGTIKAYVDGTDPSQAFGPRTVTIIGAPQPKWELVIKNADTGQQLANSSSHPAQVPSGTHLLIVPTLKSKTSADVTITVDVLAGTVPFTTLAPLTINAGSLVPSTSGDSFTAPAVNADSKFVVSARLGTTRQDFPLLITPPPAPLPDLSGAWSALGTNLTVSAPRDKPGVLASTESMSFNFTSVTPSGSSNPKELKVSGEWTLSLHLQGGPITPPGTTANLRGTVTGTIVADPDHNGAVNLTVKETVPGTAWTGTLVGTLYVDNNGFLAVKGTSLTLQAGAGKISPFRGAITIKGAWVAKGRQVTFPEPALR